MLIDADPSGNAALGLFPRGAPEVGLADALLDSMRLEEVAVQTAYPGLYVVPPGDRLSLCSEQMGSAQGLGQGREFRIRRLLKGLVGFDVVVVDTSPVLTPLNVAILYAVSEILIPIDPCVAALAGVPALEDLVRTVSEFRMEFTDAGPLTITGVLVTRADRTLVSKQIESEVRAYFGDLVYERVIPASVKFREAYARDPAGPLRPDMRGGLGVPRRGAPPTWPACRSARGWRPWATASRGPRRRDDRTASPIRWIRGMR